ncbi:MAG: hypothetical protein IT536_02580 [Hyphomicrobiales bacterium]|nr:hypothetical protein [Hyphomicrobiales bacterium]
MDQGLFGDDSRQTDLVDMARQPAPKPTPAEKPTEAAGVIERIAGEEGTDVVISRRDDGRYSVALRDTDAQETVPTITIVDTLEKARDLANKWTRSPEAKAPETGPSDSDDDRPLAAALDPARGRQQVPIVAVEDRYSGRPFAEARRAAQRWALGNIRGRHGNQSTGWIIAVRGPAIRKSTSGVRTATDLNVLAAIPRLLETAVLVESQAGDMPGIKAAHIFYGAANVAGRLHRVRLTVLEDRNGRRFYDHHSNHIKPSAEAQAGTSALRSSAALVAPTEGSIDIATLLAGVKASDPPLAQSLDLARPVPGLYSAVERVVAATKQAKAAALLTPAAQQRRRDIVRMLTQLVRLLAGPSVRIEVQFGDRLEGTRIDDMMAEGSPGYGADLRHRRPRAAYFPAERLIQVALGGPDAIGSTFHEVWHAIEIHLLKDRELALLKRETERLRPLVQRHLGLTDKQATDLAGYEVRAYAFQVYAGYRERGGKPGTGFAAHPAVRNLFARIARFFERVRSWLTRNGFRTLEDVFEQGYQGEFSTRPGLGRRRIAALAQSADAEDKKQGSRESTAGAPEQAGSPGSPGKPTPTTKAPETGPSDSEGLAQSQDRRSGEGRRHGIPQAAAMPVATFRNTQPLKRHADYTAAKAGDDAAALRLVVDLVKPEQIAQARARFGENVLYAPVAAVEASGDNAIPRALAEFYAHNTGERTNGEIVQINRTFHTGASMMERLLYRARFAGEVVRGGRYVLVDDVTTSGGSIAELTEHIRRGGGEVVGTVAVVNATRSATLSTSDDQVRTLEERLGDEIRNRLGIEPAALTAPEAGYLLRFRDVDSFRNRATEAEDERRSRLREAGIEPDRPDQVTGDPGQDDSAAPEDDASDSEGLAQSLDPATAAERARVMQGFLARGQYIDRALRIPFDIFGGKTPDGRWKPGKRLWEKHPAAMTGALLGARLGAAVTNPIGAAIGHAAGRLVGGKAGATIGEGAAAIAGGLPGYVEHERSRTGLTPAGASGQTPRRSRICAAAARRQPGTGTPAPCGCDWRSPGAHGWGRRRYRFRQRPASYRPPAPRLRLQPHAAPPRPTAVAASGSPPGAA